MSAYGIDWDAVKAAYLAGEPAARVAARFGLTEKQVRYGARKLGFRRVDAGQNRAPPPLHRMAPPEPDARRIARAAMQAADDAARLGDFRAVRAAARAAADAVKTADLIASHAKPGAATTPEEDAANMRRIEGRLCELLMAESERRAGGDTKAMPLWQRFKRPDLRPPGEMPLVYWTNGDGTKPAPEDVLAWMEEEYAASCNTNGRV